VVEHSLTPRDESKQVWPSDLPGTVAALDAAFEAWVGDLAGAPALAAANSPAAKVKAVADAVWSRLNKGAFSKDLQHAQHVFCFAALLAPDVVPGVKKQLDCAGVVTTAYAACHALSRRFSQHRDLAAARMQVSEDHCWVQLGGASVREASVEVTTDTAAKRGLPVAADAWAGWLYSGGHAVLCSPHQALAALVTSINPSISGGRQGRDSGELQEVQRRLLQVLLQQQPTALYPAALCALADLLEVRGQLGCRWDQKVPVEAMQGQCAVRLVAATALCSLLPGQGPGSTLVCAHACARWRLRMRWRLPLASATSSSWRACWRAPQATHRICLRQPLPWRAGQTAAACWLGCDVLLLKSQRMPQRAV
jgi:hypothetical protein